MNTKPDFSALLTYLPSEKGKQTTPVSSGYRPAIQFSFEQRQFTGIQNFTGTDLVFPGDVAAAEITLVNAENLSGKLYAGLDFDFFDGSVLIGHGVITKVFK